MNLPRTLAEALGEPTHSGVPQGVWDGWAQGEQNSAADPADEVFDDVGSFVDHVLRTAGLQQQET